MEWNHSDNSDKVFIVNLLITPIISPLNPLLIQLKAIARGFFVLLHIGI
jgi:hypothetical protein